MHESGELLMELFISLSFRRDVSLKKGWGSWTLPSLLSTSTNCGVSWE